MSSTLATILPIMPWPWCVLEWGSSARLPTQVFKLFDHYRPMTVKAVAVWEQVFSAWRMFCMKHHTVSKWTCPRTHALRVFNSTQAIPTTLPVTTAAAIWWLPVDECAVNWSKSYCNYCVQYSKDWSWLKILDFRQSCRSMQLAWDACHLQQWRDRVRWKFCAFICWWLLTRTCNVSSRSVIHPVDSSAAQVSVVWLGRQQFKHYVVLIPLQKCKHCCIWAMALPKIHCRDLV